MSDDLLEGAFAHAFKAAQERQAAEEAERERKAAEAAAEAAATAAVEHVYDPRPYPEAVPLDTTMYEGTGIGALYGIPGCEHFLKELGDWTLGPEPR